MLLQYISITSGPFLGANHFYVTNPSSLGTLIAICICRARTLSWFAREGLCTGEIQSVCGYMDTSVEHSRRICKILRQKSWRQERHFRDC